MEHDPWMNNGYNAPLPASSQFPLPSLCSEQCIGLPNSIDLVGIEVQPLPQREAMMEHATQHEAQAKFHKVLG